MKNIPSGSGIKIAQIRDFGKRPDLTQRNQVKFDFIMRINHPVGAFDNLQLGSFHEFFEQLDRHFRMLDAQQFSNLPFILTMSLEKSSVLLF